MIEKVWALDWTDVKKDVRQFLSPEKTKSLELWSAEFFESKVNKLRVLKSSPYNPVATRAVPIDIVIDMYNSNPRVNSWDS